VLTAPLAEEPIDVRDDTRFVPRGRGVPACPRRDAKRVRALTTLGVRHAVAGGLAVGAHGYRNTADVDLLVGTMPRASPGWSGDAEAESDQVDGVSVDLVSTSGDEAFLEHALGALRPGEVPVVPAGTLVYLKLKSPRLKDRADVVELLKAGLTLDSVRQYLEQNAPSLVARFEACVAQARSEEG
jgi:hypothetical protein